MPRFKWKPARVPHLEDHQAPVIIDRLLLAFYAVTWLNLLNLTSSAIENPVAGEYSFLLPAGLYGLLLLGFPLLNWRRFRRGRGQLSDWVWGYDDQALEQIAFIAISFVLIVWMTADNPAYVWLYF